jgi:tetratricopeptide (TPR) repeat protein
VLACFLADRASRETAIVLRGSFHGCLDHDSTLVNPLLLSLVAQLCQTTIFRQHPRFPQVIEKLSRLRESDYISVRQFPTDQLLDILDAIVEVIPTFTLVVDALDECEEPRARNSLLKYLSSLNSRPNSRVILLSRQTDHLIQSFRGMHQITLDTTTVGPDIKLYVENRIHRNKDLHTLRKDIMRKSEDDCEGMFMWAKLLLDSLEDTTTIKAQRERLKASPAKLLALYQHQFDQNSMKLTPDDRAIRDNILRLLVAVRKPMDVCCVSEAVAYNEEAERKEEEAKLLAPARTIAKLCQPLVVVCEDEARFCHTSAKEFVLGRIATQENSDAYLSRVCLNELTQPEYKSWKYPSRLLRKHLLGGIIRRHPSRAAPMEETIFKEGALYNYACQYFQDHVTALRNPSNVILKKLAELLAGNEFVTWSEILSGLRHPSLLDSQLEVRVSLLAWWTGLDPEIKPEIPIDGFFQVPHENLSSELRQKGDDVLLPYLPLMRLGQYFNLSGHTVEDYQRAYDYKRAVAAGFAKDLGPRDPLTLRAEVNVLQEFFWQNRFREAETSLLKVLEVQCEVLGPDSNDYYMTMQLIGGAQYQQGKFRTASHTLEKASSGLRRSLGDSSKVFLFTELVRGWIAEGQGNVLQAKKFYDDIYEKWVSFNQKSSPFALMLLTSMGSAYRKKQKYEPAEEALMYAWTGRLRLFTLQNGPCVDSAIQLAIVHRETGHPQKALDLLQHISQSKIFSTDFERSCQLAHLRALLAFDAGDYKRPKMSLLSLIMRSVGEDRDKNNRELLWVRLNLAHVLRSHGEADEALMLFSEIVTAAADCHSPSTDSACWLDDEPEPLDHLRDAEEALRLVRDAKSDEADQFLLERGLKWVKQEDFWIIFGGPVADTATLRVGTK